ncbi:Mediator of RNA polymerase II transcription subunit 15a [Linum perenne]
MVRFIQENEVVGLEELGLFSTMVDSAVPCVLQEDEDENDYHATDESQRCVFASGRWTNVVTSRTKSDVDVIDDGYCWRKYGQKMVKGSAYPSVLEEIDAIMLDVGLGMSSSPENRSHGKLQSPVSYLEEQQEAEEVADRTLDMDGNNYRPAAPPEREALVDGMESLKMQLSVFDQQILQELKRIAVNFEERNYTAANGHADYLRKISLKMLKLEDKFKNSLPNSSARNSEVLRDF